MSEYNFENFMIEQDKIMAKNILLERGCMNCDWLHGGDMTCGKRVKFCSYEYGDLPKAMTCTYWKDRYN